MKRVANEELSFESSDRYLLVGSEDYVGIDEDNNICVANDEGTSAVLTERSGGFTGFDRVGTNAEKRELAVHMMRRWAKYGGIGTITVADAHDVRVTRAVFALDLDNEKA